MDVNSESFLSFLSENSLLGATELTAAVNYSRDKHCSLWAAISQQKFIESDSIYETVCDYFDLIFFKLEPARVDANLEIGKFNLSEGLRLNSIPLFRFGDKIVVGMDNPLDVFFQEELNSILGKETIPILCPYEDIHRFLNQRYPSNDLDLLVQEMQATQPAQRADDVVGESWVNLDVVENPMSSPVIRFVNSFLTQAIREKASDIHIEQTGSDVRLRFRIDGVLRDIVSFPRFFAAELVSRIKILSELDISEKRLPQDGHIKLIFDSRPFDLRVSTLPSSHGEKIVLRVLDKSRVMVQLKNLAFSKDVEGEIVKLCRQTHGLILVTGPTGSGKTTTLYGMLNQVNKPDVNIVTLEDPVEYEIPGITQVQVQSSISLTFSRALRSILRQDPNIILVGEIRDPETAGIAVESSLTGHLLLSTLHTNDAATAVGRLIDMEVEPYLLSSSLLAVLAQRLVRRVCEDCKSALPSHLVDKYRDAGIEEPRLFYGAGCENCFQSGLKDRIGVHELLIPDEKLKAMINNNTPSEVMKDYACEIGMKTLRTDGLAKAGAGMTTLEEIEKVIPV